jgi:hypothetical protein
MSGLRGVVPTVRFLSELAMLLALAYGGFRVFDGVAGWVAGVGAPLVAVVFAVAALSTSWLNAWTEVRDGRGT